VAVGELDVLLADAAVKGQARVCGAQLGRARLLVHGSVEEEDLVQQAEEGEAQGEADERHKHPVAAQPEDDLDVRVVPAVAKVVREEAPWVVVVFIREENAHAVVALGPGVVVVAPDETKVERARRSHDSDVGQGPAAVVVGQRVDSLEEEWVARNCAHGVVGDARGESAANPGGVGEEGVEAAVASLGKSV
jgi:hypothetical protein